MTDLCKHELSKHICIRCCRTERDALAAELAQWKNDNLEIAGKFTKANYRIRDLEAALLTILGKSWTAHDLSLLIHPLLPFTQLETACESNDAERKAAENEQRSRSWQTAWDCAKCGQKNSGYADTCGRCNTANRETKA